MNRRWNIYKWKSLSVDRWFSWRKHDLKKVHPRDSMLVIALTYFKGEFSLNSFWKTRNMFFILGIKGAGEAVSASIVDAHTEGSTQKQQLPECLPVLFQVQCSSLEHCPVHDALFGILFTWTLRSCTKSLLSFTLHQKWSNTFPVNS